ncbi:PRC-barrel domain-containing protein [Micromonospora sp. CPCC 206061]|uniref:PRC-barrel domain-containing protein n=1 Tax=Micromonospora sp. CPCC 206061 TaxID=3122410 RepID=UPI002FF3C65B
MQPIPFAPWVWRDPGLIAATVGTEMEPRGDRPEDDERASADLAGYDVEAIDGGIGKVDEANYEVGSAYLVIDTGPWIFGRKVLLPAGTVDRVDHDGRKVYVDRTKEQVKNSPEYDKDTFGTAEYRDRVGGYYAGTYE